MKIESSQGSREKEIEKLKKYKYVHRILDHMMFLISYPQGTALQ